MFGIGVIPALIQFSGLVFMPESPRWLIKNGRHEEARAALRAIRDRGVDVQEEFDLLRVTIDEESRAGTTGKTRSILCIYTHILVSLPNSKYRTKYCTQFVPR